MNKRFLSNLIAGMAALSKCDALEGVAEKQQCVDGVRKQYGQM